MTMASVRLALALALVLLATPAVAQMGEQIICGRIILGPRQQEIVDPYTDARCTATPGPIDCVHFALFGAGATSYVTLMHEDATGQVTKYVAVWAPSPGWFHAPQMPIVTPGLNRLLVAEVAGKQQNFRLVIRGMATGQMGCP